MRQIRHEPAPIDTEHRRPRRVDRVPVTRPRGRFGGPEVGDATKFGILAAPVITVTPGPHVWARAIDTTEIEFATPRDEAAEAR